MDANLDKSVRLLDSVLLTPGRKSKKKTEGIFQDFNFDLSMTIAPHEIKRIINNEGFSLYDDSEATILQAEEFNLTQVNSAPCRTAVNSLYTQFFEILQSQPGGNILDVVADFALCCSDTLKVIQAYSRKGAKYNIDDEAWLENECNTWRLLLVLYRDRLLIPTAFNNIEDQYLCHSEQECIENLFKNDRLVRETQLIIDWLESSSAINDEIPNFSDSNVGWENTLHQLQSAENIAFISSRQIITQMDPDAPNFLKKPLHDIDADDEKKLSKTIFTKIRSGKLEDAQKIYRESGHAWKAAILEGWRLYHDRDIKKNADSKENQSGKESCVVGDDSYKFMEIKGNNNRDIWKNIALKYCKQDYINEYDKATVGSFCGYLNSVLPVCYSWEDYLWAYMKTVIDIRVETEVRDICVRNKEYVPLPEEYWAQRLSLHDIFTNLESSKVSTVREESHKQEHIIQKLIILDEIPILLQELEEWIEDPSLSTHFLRFVAHIVLFFNLIGRGYDGHIIEKVLEAYIKKLMKMKETQLVAYYVSKLNMNNQIQIYAQYLQNIVDNDERKASLVYAENNDIDVYAVTKQVVENIRNLPDDIEDGDLMIKITDLDMFKISALDWILFYENQWPEAIIQANALIFTYFTLEKLDAAQLAFNKIPTEAVDKIVGAGIANNEFNQIIKEYFCYKSYLDAVDAFNEWFKQHKCKPASPEALSQDATFPEKVAHQHKLSQYTAEIERWKLATAHKAKNAKTMLYNVLLFPGGWLNEIKHSEYLKFIYVPEIVLLLYSILFTSGQHEECMQLADIIASEKYSIYKVYTKEKLRAILLKFCENSVVLLNSEKDPWGN